MDTDPLRDPRSEKLPPTPEEIDAWATREKKRREHWLAGPGQDEQDDWARRHRRRAALGLAESRLGPSADDVARWTAQEHARRQAWLAGPTDEEKREWSRSQRRRDDVTGAEQSPSPEEVDTWADRERRRRQEWLAGPTDDEKQTWARRETGGWWECLPGAVLAEGALGEATDRWLREADLAAKGSLLALMRAPYAIWSYLVRSGRTLEDELYQPAPQRRVKF